MARLLILLALLLPQDRRGVFRPGESVPDGVKVERDLAYGKKTKQKLDIYRVKSSKEKPLVIFLHGGGWRSKDKKDAAAWMGWLAKEGYVVASVNYRLSTTDKYPAQIEDCRDAVKWLKKNAKKYGINKDKVAAIGASAAAHLAALTGVKYEELQAVVSYFGPHDIIDQPKNPRAGSWQLIGGSVDEKPDAWKDASCSTHITKDDPPVLMIHGDNDKTVPLSQSENFKKNLEAKGVSAELIVVKGAGHGLKGRNIKPSFGEIDKKVLAFLKKHLR